MRDDDYIIFLRLKWILICSICPSFSFIIIMRLSCLESAYLKIEQDNLLPLEGCKFTTECLAGVVVLVNRGECQCC